MQTDTFYINENVAVADLIETRLSFKPFIDYLKTQINAEKNVKSRFYKFVLSQFTTQLKLANAVKSKEVQTNTSLLELMYAALSPIVQNKEAYLWALSTPVPNKMLYSTDAFYQFISKINGGKSAPAERGDDLIFQRKQLGYIYNLILKRLYHYAAAPGAGMYQSYQHPDTNLYTHYQINIDDSFVEVEVQGKLPALSLETIEQYMHGEIDVTTLAAILPLRSFCFKGFSIVTATDVTFLHAFQEIRDALEDQPASDDKLYTKVIRSLQTLAGNSEIAFGLTPFVKVNRKPVTDIGLCLQSLLLTSADRFGYTIESVFQSFINEYSERPRMLSFSSITELEADQPLFLQILKQANIRSYSVLPVIHNKQFIGIIEVYSHTERSISATVLSAIEVAVPLLAQLLQNTIENFNAKINRVIREQFISLQPSVQWKFNEVAWEYLKKKTAGSTGTPIGKVGFKNVYPLYGAVDIRNSTSEQSMALQRDVINMVNTIQATLTALMQFGPSAEIDILFTKSAGWLTRASAVKGGCNETQFDRFIDTEVKPLLTAYQDRFPEANALVNSCREYIGDGCSGPAYSNRQQLEDSIQLINTAISSYLNEARQELQSIFPSYFESIRTDGVEYDMYVGQSIAPDQPFTEAVLEAVCLWQIRTMAQVARLTYALQNRMQRPLQTTQLIFIHGNTIDILFRNDERRFDVEGTYNIRYEVIKKRIDKVMLHDKSQRLTQPGKIAFVFYDAKQQKKYEEYIRHFQEEQLLEDDFEQLDLEELQGVHGLKALRVGVKMQ